MIKLLERKNKKASIVIFDEDKNFGCGEVYNSDYPWLLMNTPVEDLSAVYGVLDDYIDWNRTKNNGVIKRYVSRSNFGIYLKSKLSSIIYAVNVQEDSFKEYNIVHRVTAFYGERSLMDLKNYEESSSIFNPIRDHIIVSMLLVDEIMNVGHHVTL
ncbi:FAD/NAD(P)-binding protein [Photorhabdus temperata]|uniref:FAD/NAD(P)-binding protein n=1 Tax=Photorhabdus temperata TaxID=574560 RepID=UPI0021D4F625|nr:FAD/NAD(P)-binding protein [Photorhabdus temperata]MCT8348468.1 FAD/NAD(P)-binding protein [Photorhabdus temperata]